MPSGTAVQRLRRPDFSFHGFDRLQAELDAYLNDVWIRSGDPLVMTVENAVYIPAVRTTALGQHEGALLTADGQPIPTAQTHRRFGAFGNELLGSLSQPVDLAPARVIEEEVVYLGWIIDHFGHVLLESLARTWLLKSLDPSVKALFHLHGHRELSTTLVRMLEAFGLPQERILVLDEQTTLRRVIVPEALYEISYAAHVRTPDAYRGVAAAIVGGVDRSDQPVYLSRRLLSGRLRPIVGELDLEEVLRENGFLVVHPELMSFEDQVRLVNRHRDIFSSAGSAAYLPLFALQPPRIHLLTAGLPFHDYFLIPKVLGAEASFCNCFTGDNNPSRHHLPPVLEMAKLVDYLDTQGLLTSRLRATVASRVKDYTAEADELRLVAFFQLSTSRQDRLDSVIEAEAAERSRTSWPLCWILARYYLNHDHGGVEEYVDRFLTLAEGETDVSRLVKFQPDVTVGAGQIRRVVPPATRRRLDHVLKERFLIDIEAERARRRELRDTRRANGAGGRRRRALACQDDDGD